MKVYYSIESDVSFITFVDEKTKLTRGVRVKQYVVNLKVSTCYIYEEAYRTTSKKAIEELKASSDKYKYQVLRDFFRGLFEVKHLQFVYANNTEFIRGFNG